MHLSVAAEWFHKFLHYGYSFYKFASQNDHAIKTIHILLLLILIHDPWIYGTVIWVFYGSSFLILLWLERALTARNTFIKTRWVVVNEKRYEMLAADGCIWSTYLPNFLFAKRENPSIVKHFWEKNQHSLETAQNAAQNLFWSNFGEKTLR